MIVSSQFALDTGPSRDRHCDYHINAPRIAFPYHAIVICGTLNNWIMAHSGKRLLNYFWTGRHLVFIIVTTRPTDLIGKLICSLVGSKTSVNTLVLILKTDTTSTLGIGPIGQATL